MIVFSDYVSFYFSVVGLDSSLRYLVFHFKHLNWISNTGWFLVYDLEQLMNNSVREVILTETVQLVNLKIWLI